MILFKRLKDKYGAFSNFSNHPIKIGTITFPTNEHYFQAMKFAGNDVLFNLVANAESPFKAKDHAYTHQDRWIKGWHDIKINIMTIAVREKVRQHADVRELLLSTGNEMIGEESDKDPIWGVGADGKGQNLLGKIWMKIREEVRQEGSKIDEFEVSSDEENASKSSPEA